MPSMAIFNVPSVWLMCSDDIFFKVFAAKWVSADKLLWLRQVMRHDTSLLVQLLPSAPFASSAALRSRLLVVNAVFVDVNVLMVSCLSIYKRSI